MQNECRKDGSTVTYNITRTSIFIILYHKLMKRCILSFYYYVSFSIHSASNVINLWSVLRSVVVGCYATGTFYFLEVIVQLVPWYFAGTFYRFYILEISKIYSFINICFPVIKLCSLILFCIYKFFILYSSV